MEVPAHVIGNIEASVFPEASAHVKIIVNYRVG